MQSMVSYLLSRGCCGMSTTLRHILIILLFIYLHGILINYLLIAEGQKVKKYNAN